VEGHIGDTVSNDFESYKLIYKRVECE